MATQVKGSKGTSSYLSAVIAVLIAAPMILAFVFAKDSVASTDDDVRSIWGAIAAVFCLLLAAITMLGFIIYLLLDDTTSDSTECPICSN